MLVSSICSMNPKHKKFRLLYLLVVTVFAAGILLPPTTGYGSKHKKSKNKNTNPDGNWHHARPWVPTAESDVLFKKRVWREIDIRERQNADLRSDSIPFFALLNGAIEAGNIVAYKPENDSLGGPFSIPEFRAMNFERYKNEVKKFQVREDWIFDKKQGLMLVHIFWIAPSIARDSTIKPLFWVNYPGCSDFFAHNTAARTPVDSFSWYDYFESRIFASKIIAVGVRGTDSFSLDHDTWVY